MTYIFFMIYILFDCDGLQAVKMAPLELSPLATTFSGPLAGLLLDTDELRLDASALTSVTALLTELDRVHQKTAQVGLAF